MNEFLILFGIICGGPALLLAATPFAYIIYRFEGGRMGYFKWLKNL